jgi:hypothetical protein
MHAWFHDLSKSASSPSLQVTTRFSCESQGLWRVRQDLTLILATHIQFEWRIPSSSLSENQRSFGTCRELPHRGMNAQSAGAADFRKRELPASSSFATCPFLLTCLKHMRFTATSLAHPPHFLAIVERNTNTHPREWSVTYFCDSGCATSCPDDEIIRAWMTRPLRRASTPVVRGLRPRTTMHAAREKTLPTRHSSCRTTNRRKTSDSE